MASKSRLRPWGKRILLIIAVLFIGGVVTAWYIFTKKFDDTSTSNADYSVEAVDLIREFKNNDAAVNQKYTEKILVVNGTVTEIETADSTFNVKIADTTTGSYLIFAFQEQHLAEAKTIREGSRVSIKGSCSGGIYSKIMEANIISFKRCALNQ